MYACLFDDPDLINRMLGRMLAVTPAAIQAVAGEVFRADNRVVMTYVPALPPVDAVPAEETPGPLDADDGVDGDDEAVDQEAVA